MTASEEIVSWAWALTFDDIPDDAVHAASRHLMDGVGCAMAAARVGAAQPAVDAAMSMSMRQESTIIGHGDMVPAPMAALANGVLIHALDYDDTHARALVHSTAAVLPAAFAVAERVNATGRDLLTAMVAGYEGIARLGAAVPHGFHSRGLHATSVCGVFASALAAARLEGLEQTAAVSALGIAGSMASGLLEFLNTGSSTKQLHPGWSSMSGIMAARLAGSGASGPETVLEGNNGLFMALVGETPDRSALTADLGNVWETTQITIKPYPACQLSHASLDALLALRGKVSDVELIDEVVFEVHEDSVPIICEPATGKLNPRSDYEAKFSLPWCAATLMIDGQLGLSSFTPAQIGRKDLAGLAAKIRYIPVSGDAPAASQPGRVAISFTNAQSVNHEVLSSRGTPQAPLSDDELIGKFVENCGGVASSKELAVNLLAIGDRESLQGLLR